LRDIFLRRPETNLLRGDSGVSVKDPHSHLREIDKNIAIKPEFDSLLKKTARWVLIGQQPCGEEAFPRGQGRFHGFQHVLGRPRLVKVPSPMAFINSGAAIVPPSQPIAVGPPGVELHFLGRPDFLQALRSRGGLVLLALGRFPPSAGGRAGLGLHPTLPRI
jgi:hypothetical protein